MYCWKCKNNDILNKKKVSKHHIQGHLKGLEIPLCKTHHNLIEGICGKCQDQQDCWLKKFKQCWHFEDSLPPIFFRPKQISIDADAFEANCPKCKSSDIKRISLWKRTILPLEAYWKCNKCQKIFSLSLDDWRATDLPTIGPDKLKHIFEAECHKSYIDGPHAVL